MPTGSRVSVAVFIVLFACGEGSGSDRERAPAPADKTLGATIYASTVQGGNSFTCSTCHALTEPASDDLRRPGHPLGDPATRGTYKNGALDQMREAVNSCLTEWMNADAWTADDERWLALGAFLQSEAKGARATPLRFDIVAPLADLSGEGPVTAPPEQPPGEVDAGVSSPGCAQTHPKLGWVATLDTLFHGVSGRAEIVDDCTVEFTRFSYDGTGIDVRIYGAQNGDFGDGFAMSDDLLRAGGYEQETLTATLPAGVTLDELGGVSVWCVDVGVDFGSGSFAPP